MEEEISLLEIFEIIKKRIAMILIMALVGAGLAGAVTFFVITPKYSASAELIVQGKNDANSTNNLQADVNANVLMINTYKDMIMGKMILTRVQQELANNMNYDLSVTQLKDMISVIQSNQSQVFQIQATSTNPTQAMDIANETAQMFQKSAAEAIDVNKVTITSDAELPTKPVSPNNKLNIAVGFVVGLMLGIGLAFLLAFLDKSIKNQKFITEELELPILGVITQVDKKDLKAGKEIILSDEEEVIEEREESEEREEVPTRRRRKR